MLFHITHQHSPEACPSNDKARMQKTFGRIIHNTKRAHALGIKILGAYVDAPAHTIFMIIDASANDQIFQFLRPTLKLATVSIRPVEDASVVVQRLLVD